jgi:pimeloyl-ACP methyl ester carboxylesterase
MMPLIREGEDRLRPTTLGTVALALTLAACSGETPSLERISPSPSKAATSGRVDVGGYELAWTCQGEGSPTILTEDGYNSPGTSTYAELMEPMSDISRVCMYDRAGTGTSDHRSAGLHVTSQLEAKELHDLLEGAAIAPPYVVVAHSYGGFVARLFAATYASETAGLVLIDSSHEDEIEPYRRFYGDSPEGDWVDGGDLIDIDATRHALRTTARDYGDLPLAVVKAGTYEDVLTVALWDRTQADLATLSSNSVLVQAQGGHFVMDDDPRVLVTAIRVVVSSARAGEPLPSCRELVADTDGRCPDRSPETGECWGFPSAVRARRIASWRIRTRGTATGS